ncbi:MAG: sodium/proline symporter [Planctomycetota bacterium]|nr:MAG: sodium/proline symporter [Planctomycetota bacterium]REJ87875.1 MAG: sodium/proline symporter [Planctomycetota bacterium]REK38711.1 MAG: sodium/proline symporter [Planctomycetota bacterium]
MRELLQDPVAISFFVYTLAIFGLGIYSARLSKGTAADFFLADRGLGAWVAALSASASAESGWVTMGLVGMAYKTGVAALWIVVGTFAAFLFNWFVIAWRLRTSAQQSDSLTLPDVLAAPHRGSAATMIRIVGVLIILSMLAAYVAANLNAAGKMFQETFDWTYATGVLIGAGFVIIYTITGGFRAVAWTDVVQGSFMIFIVIVLPVMLISKIGGWNEFWSKLAADPRSSTLTDPVAGNTGLALIGFFALYLGIPLGNPGQPHVLIRLMAVKDKTAVLRGGVISSAWVVALFTGAIFLGMAARVTFGEMADPEATLMVIATDSSIVPGFVGGMIIAAVLAAICSTVDSQLLVSASAVSHDVMVKLFGIELSPKVQMVIDRLAVLAVGAIATAIAMSDVRSVFDFVLAYGWAGLGAGFGPALIMTLLWRRTTGWGVVTGMVVGVATAIIWKQFPDLQKQVYNLVPAFAFSLMTIVIVSLAMPKPRNDSASAADGAAR